MTRNRSSVPTEYRLVATLLLVIIGSYLATQWLLSSLDSGTPTIVVDAIEVSVISILATVGLWWTLLRGLRERHRSQTFDQQLQAALQMAATETAGHEVVRRALDSIGVLGHAQLKLADSSEAHLKVAVDHQRGTPVAACDVSAPFDCPAIRRAQTSRFGSDKALDACPWLIERSAAQPAGVEAGAVCVPINVVGRAIGVLHIAGHAGRLPSATMVRDVEAIAERAGTRLGMLRVMAQTHLQAATDPLTGLLNRRSLENQVHELLRSQRQFSLAMGDLDHFKALNDTHGHDAGDRALRVFSRTVRAALRGDDIISRYGGEEFVFVLPGLTSAEAASALERIRESLALAVNAGNVPPFTASFGVADSTSAADIEELLRLADNALFQAKRDGRNRVVIDRAGTHEQDTIHTADHGTARASAQRH